MVFQKSGQNPQQPRPKKVKDDCVIDVKKTQHGSRIKISGNCKREQIEMARAQGMLED